MKIKRRERRTYTDDFKQQMVTLYQQGKTRSELVLQYELTPSALDRWITQYSTTGSFKTKDNRSTEDEDNELLALYKENKRLLMENDILKQAALIMGRKSQ